jgi:hypothetical protein
MSSVRLQIFIRPARSGNRILPCRSNLLPTRSSQSPSLSWRRKLARTDLASPVRRHNQKARKMVPAMRRQLQKLALRPLRGPGRNRVRRAKSGMAFNASPPARSPALPVKAVSAVPVTWIAQPPSVARSIGSWNSGALVRKKIRPA